MTELETPLSNVQLEILKLYSTNLTDSELFELKDQLAHFYAKKAMDEADKIWKEKGLSNEIMDEWLNEENQ